MQQSPPSLLSLRSAVFELLPDPILAIDQAEMLLDANAAARQLFQIEAPVAGQRIPVTLQAQLSDSACEGIPGPIPATSIVLSRENELHPYQYFARPLHDEAGSRTGTLLHLQALSEPVLAKEVLSAPSDAPTRQVTESALHKIGVAITSGLEMKSVLRAILDECRQVLPVDTLYVALYDRTAGTFQFALFWDQGTYRTMAPIPLRSRPSLTAAVIDRGATLYLPDWRDPATAAAHPAIKIADASTRSWLGTPLLVHGEVIGVLSIQHLAPDRYTADHIRLLEMIATQAAIAVENARLYELAQQKLTERNRMAERLTLATEVANIGVWDWERSDDELVWDEQMRTMHGVGPDTLVTFAAWQALIHPEDLPGTLEAVEATIAGGAHANVEYRVVHPDSSIHYILGAGGIVKDAHGELVRQIGVCRDITDRRQMEETLRETEARFRTMAEVASIPLVLLRLDDGMVLYANLAATETSGFALQDLVGTAAGSYVISVTPDRAEIRRMLLAGEPVRNLEVQLIKANGAHFYGLLSIDTGTHQGEPVALVALSDLTERKRMEDALRISEEHYRLLVDNIEDIVWTVDLEGCFLYVSPSVEHQFGYAPDELTGQIFDKWLSPTSAILAREMLASSASKVLAGQHIEPTRFESKHIRKDGSSMFAQTVGVPLLDKCGQVVGFQGVTRDISERKRAEDALRVMLTKYAVLFDTVPVGISITDDTGQIIECNPEAERILGIGQDEHLQRAYDGPEWQIIRPDGTPMPPDEYASVRALTEKQRIGDIEMGIVRNDGVTAWIKVDAAPISLPGYGVAIAYVDITEREGIARALRESEARWQFALEGAGDGVWDWNALTDEVFYSRQWKAMLGFTEDEIGSTLDEWETRVHPDDRPHCNAELRRHFAGETPIYQCEHRLRCKDGTYKWILDRGKVIARTDDGMPGRVIGTHSDISELKRAEAALRQSEARFATAFNASPLPIAIAQQADGCYLDANPAYLAMVGYSREELIGHTPIELGIVTAEHHAELVAMAKAQGHARNLEAHLAARDGRRIDIISASEPIEVDGEPCRLLIFIDITERRRLEQALLESEERFRLIVQNSPDVIALYDDGGRLVYLSPTVETILGVSAERTLALEPLLLEALRTLPGDSPNESELARILAHPQLASRRWALAAVEYCLQHPKEPHRIETTNTLPSGERRYFDTVCQAYPRGAAGYQVVTITRDITERTQMEEALRTLNAELDQRVAERTAELHETLDSLQQAGEALRVSEAKWRSVFELLPVGVSIVDAEHRVTDSNTALADILQLTKPGIEQRAYSTQRYFHPDRSLMLHDEFPSMRALREQAIVRDVEIGIETEDGAMIWSSVSAAPLTPGSVAVVTVDITERKQLELALHDAIDELKRANAGKDAFMAAVSHELRTPLTGIIGIAETLEAQVRGPLNENQLRYLTSLNASAHRLLQKITAVLNYTSAMAADSSPEPEACRLVELCAACVRLARSNAEAKQQVIDMDVEPIDLALFSDGDSIQKILNALLGNAVKFTPPHGHLGVSITQQGEAAELAVWDTGIGISADHMPYLFKPFTQVDQRLSRQYEGIGLGLAYTKRLVELLGGTIDVESTPGEGSRFTVRLPGLRRN